MKRGGNFKSNFSKKRPDNRPSWKEEPHAGSVPMDQIKASEAYARRITQENAAKRKYALCVSYLGTNYQGLQINPDARTIESELERALFLAGGIIESNFGFMNKIQWTRAARTENRETFINQVNSFLPEDIKVQTMTKVSKGFNAKNLCTKREYHYMLPTFALMPFEKAHKHLADQYAIQGPIVGAGSEGGYIDPNTSKCLHRASLDQVRPFFVPYRIEASQLEVFQTALRKYEGTHSYHNFTTGKDSSEASAKRYVLSFTCSAPILDEDTGIEWLHLSVLGQSFLLHQIRKMVGLAIDVARGYTSMDTMDIAFAPQNKMEVSMAPALGLYLNNVFFDGYNIKQHHLEDQDERATLRREHQGDRGKDGDDDATHERKEAAEDDNAQQADDGDDKDEQGGLNRECIDWYSDEVAKSRLEAFRTEVLVPHIHKQEIKSMEFFYFLDHNRAFGLSYKPRTEVEKKTE
eukprot:gene28399-34286_t